MANDWLVWQLADSAFPSGGFAHSGGVEAAFQLGLARDAESLERWLNASIVQIEKGVARFADAAWRAPEDFRDVDQDCDLFLSNHVANRASRAQGQAMISSAAKAFVEPPAKHLIAQWARAARRERLAAHFAPVFGVVSRALGIESAQAGELFLFMHIRSYISAAVRLGIVGPMQAQQIQSRLAARAIESAGITDSTPPVAVQINPVLDLVQTMQDRLYSRLFQS